MSKKNTGVASTPSGQTPTLKKIGSTGEKSQKTLHGFFSKTPSTASSATALPTRLSPRKNNGTLKSKMLAPPSSSHLTPAPSSDAVEPEEDLPQASQSPRLTGLPSPLSSANSQDQTKGDSDNVTAYGTPSRKVYTTQSTHPTVLTQRRQRRRSSSTPNPTARAQTMMLSSGRPRPRIRRGQSRGGKFPRARTKTCTSKMIKSPWIWTRTWTTLLLPTNRTKK